MHELQELQSLQTLQLIQGEDSMPLSSLDEIAMAIASGLNCDHSAFCLQLLRLLANGCPVSPEQLATTLHLSRDQVNTILPQLTDIEYDREGNIVASGLSLVPTSHHFHLNGHTLYTWCAVDALAYPYILQQPARVESPCPITGTRISMKITPENIQSLEPASTVVSFVIPEKAKTCCNVRNTFCCYVHFFSSPEAAAMWRSQHQEAIILPVDHAYRVARMVARHRYGEVISMLRFDSNTL
jgi:alkylmercury lyase